MQQQYVKQETDMRKHLIYSLLMAALALTGCRGGNQQADEKAQVDSFYKSTYDDGKTVQEQSKSQEGKDYKSTGDASISTSIIACPTVWLMS